MRYLASGIHVHNGNAFGELLNHETAFGRLLHVPLWRCLTKSRRAAAQTKDDHVRAVSSRALSAREACTRLEYYRIAQYILLHTWSEIRELRLLGPAVVSHESTFLKDVP